MNMRLGALLPRAVLVALAWVLATAAFTLAADKSIIGPSAPGTTTAAAPPTLTIPAVTGQAFVFAKGLLEDAGFAWRVSGPVHGYAGNQVVSQTPGAGTRVVDTGAPTVVLRLAKSSYAQKGVPEDSSSYPGTRIELAGSPASSLPHAPATTKTAKTKPAVKKPPARKPAKKPKPAAPAKRTPAFHAPGTKREPLNEISLPARADRLAAWIATKPRHTSANVRRWLYQHAWIVDGANFGWWHGDQALVKLIAVDRNAERMWGIGHRSEVIARAALARVRRLSR